MLPELSSMNAAELLREFILLNKVRENIEHLIIYNSNLGPCIDKVDRDIKRIKGQLFYKYHQLNKVDLHSLVDYSALQNRMLKYIEPSSEDNLKATNT
ncbi:hypothetical protein ACVLD2_001681 [Paenibacillus sp. PvR052]|nr:hypothetical protein [Paenibacillus sp. PvP091]MBP1170201.1 hypothetical protein [Paenibacillus sp. PvR098]MBP2441229.1 hypothetical protein [Paenibacillus sp. PvP052]